MLNIKSPQTFRLWKTANTAISSHRRMLHRAPRLLHPAIDFRSFLQSLKDEGDLIDIYQEVDPHLEVGGIARLVSERNAKAPLFHNVKGAKRGLWKMVSNLQSLRKDPRHRLGRIALGLGLPTDASWKDINQKLLAANRSHPAPSKVLETGPCKENKLLGDKLILCSFLCHCYTRMTEGNTSKRTECIFYNSRMVCGLIGRLHER